MTQVSTHAATDLVLTSPDAATRLAVAYASGGRLSALWWHDLQLIGRGGERVVDWGCFPMAPFAGRIRRGAFTWQGQHYQVPINASPHAMHGVVFDRAWHVLALKESSVEMRCDFDGRWPWRGHAIQRITVANDMAQATLEVHAHHRPMPAWAGYHPWFSRQLSRGGAVQLDTGSAQILPRDDDGMPRPEPVAAPPGPWDDVFVNLTGPARLTWPDAAQLTVRGSGGYLVVFDAKDAAVCAEPQTAPPNAIELGLAATVTPEEPLILTMELELSRPD